MEDNILTKILQQVQLEDKKEDVLSDMLNLLANFDKIYSYIVYQIYNEDTLIRYTIQYTISQKDEYNTIDVSKVIIHVIDMLFNKQRENKKVIGYGQPALDVALEAYDPLIHKLAKYENSKWKQFDYEDLCQICRLVMCKLHKKGYYIHKRLLQKAFTNEILMSIRHEKNAPIIVSFEDCFYSKASGDSDDLTVADTIPDMSIQEKEEKEYEEIAEKLIFEEVKDIVVELIGIRQWNELMRDYGNKHTTAWSRKLMQKIKRHFETLGLTRKDFNKKYYG